MPGLPASSDDVRSASLSGHVQRVRLDEPVRLKLGGVLPSVTVAYETWGELNEDASNAVLVCHAISGDSHVARHGDDDTPGWWDTLVGPGEGYAIDIRKYFVIGTNVLGGCRGTTGPCSTDPATGEAYGAGFPDITIEDMVEVQRRLVEGLGIERLLAVVGGSLGGHQALTWAIRHPDRVRLAAAFATSPRLTSQSLAFDIVARNAIQSDPHFHGGQYYDKPTRPDVGLAIARMLGHITYLSPEAMADKFDPDRHEPQDIRTEFEKKFSVGSYLAHQGRKFVERFDANTYVTLSMAMDLFDLGRTPGEVRASLAGATCDWLVCGFSSDWLFPPSQSREIVDALCGLGQAVTYAEVTTDAGHDAFLLEKDVAKFGPLLGEKLGRMCDVRWAKCDVSEEGESSIDTPCDAALTSHIAHRTSHIEDPSHADPTSIYHGRRLDYDTILSLIDPGASVLDLGCGRGGLLAEVARRRGEDATSRGGSSGGRLLGVEVDQENILATVERGIDVIDIDVNKGLPMFADGQFDVVVLSQTLQAVEDVERVLGEMLRVGRRGVVSFPNFGHRPLRDAFYHGGRSPRAAGMYGYEWYNTPNRRFPTIADFDDFCRAKMFHVEHAVYLDTARGVTVQDEPNLEADTAVYVLSRGGRARAES